MDVPLIPAILVLYPFQIFRSALDVQLSAHTGDALVDSQQMFLEGIASVVNGVLVPGVVVLGSLLVCCYRLHDCSSWA